MTKAGGIDLPGAVAGVVALDEIVLHGWDVARASGQAYAADPAAVEAVHGFLAQFATPEQAAMRSNIFGPIVAVADEAPAVRPGARPGREGSGLDTGVTCSPDMASNATG